MAPPSSKTIMDLFQPAKRIKLSSSPPSSPGSLKPLAKTIAGSASSSDDLTVEQKARIELNKLRAKCKLNLKACSELVSLAKDKIDSNSISETNGGYVKLEELLVEETWREALPGELQKPYARNLCTFLESEIRRGSVPIYPPQDLIFNALNSTPFDALKAVIIGQDPYHGPRQAMGLSFSVPHGIKPPSSLVNIFKELKADLGCTIPSHGNLESWAFQGVLLLNAVLTVRSHQANSHAKKGWEQFTDSVIRTISQKKKGIIFLLWGNSAQEKSNCINRELLHRLIDGTKHHILKAAHPSGLSANRGFFGCRHFSRTNQLLEQMGIPPIDWQL
ncbi:hypothetical protein Tsubulata_025350 [Turnera subulata]|uniref:Uracil-DNA glycosylase n=1 Tax=Turnera subulata TaxID=218843 RepID=A0A9Q0FXM8_9ROSI|nr:hypothetical protein Tsubulata_025350 [Turnera subulata]